MSIRIEVTPQPSITVVSSGDCQVDLTVNAQPEPQILIADNQPSITLQILTNGQTLLVENPVMQVVEINLPGIPGPPGSALPFLNKFSDTIPANTTKVVDSTALSFFTAIDYTISIFNKNQGVFHSRKQMLTRKGPDIEDTPYAKVGNTIQFSLDLNLIGSDAKMVVGNNQNYDLDIVFVKTIL